MKQRDYRKSVEDPFRYDHDDHYYLPEDEIVAQRENKMKFDFNKSERRKKELLLEHQDDDVHELYDRIISYIRDLKNGVIKREGIDIHKIANFGMVLMNDQVVLENMEQFKGSLKDLGKTKFKSGAKFLDNILTAMIQFNFH